MSNTPDPQEEAIEKQELNEAIKDFDIKDARGQLSSYSKRIVANTAKKFAITIISNPVVFVPILLFSCFLLLGIYLSVQFSKQQMDLEAICEERNLEPEECMDILANEGNGNILERTLINEGIAASTLACEQTFGLRGVQKIFYISQSSNRKRSVLFLEPDFQTLYKKSVDTALDTPEQVCCPISYPELWLADSAFTGQPIYQIACCPEGVTADATEILYPEELSSEELSLLNGSKVACLDNNYQIMSGGIKPIGLQVEKAL